MASKAEHIIFSEENERVAADFLGSEDAASRRWGVVAAYYSILHLLHAGAADRQNHHPEEHGEAWNVIYSFDPIRRQLHARVHEFYMLSHHARYMKREGNRAGTWYVPLFPSESEAIDRASALLTQLSGELRRVMKL